MTIDDFLFFQTHEIPLKSFDGVMTVMFVYDDTRTVGYFSQSAKNGICISII